MAEVSDPALAPIGTVQRTRIGRKATEPMRQDIRLLGGILSDTIREQNGEQVFKRALPCGDYGLIVDGALVASVERKSLADLVASLTGGKLHYQVADLAALPRAAVVVEDRYSQLFKLDHVRPAVVADGLAELHIRWPAVPVVFCETRQLGEESTYRFLAAARAWATTEHQALQRISPDNVVVATDLDQPPAGPEPSTAEVRAWARSIGLSVPDRGRLRPEIWRACHDAHAPA